MTSSNRTQVLLVRETTAGTTPVTPRMRTMRITGEGLSFTPDYVDPDELRADRMLGDPIKVMQASTGPVNFELSYPDDEEAMSEIYRSAYNNPWVNTAQRDNDGTPDSVITDIGTVANTITFLTGTAFVIGQLVRTSGFTTAANNTVARVTTGGATSLVATAGGYVGEAAPPGTARVKVVGFQGASADITATATGLASTVLDFTTLGLVVGQWVKVGGTAAGDMFATAVLNDWMRITAITATALTLDNRPVGWTTDAGTGKTIKVWFGDQIRNGTTQTNFSIEKGFLGQTVPTYIVNTGMVVNTLDHALTSRDKITGSANFVGMGGSQSTTALDASPDAATTGQVMAANANVGRLGENGAQVTSPNWARELTFQINNNLQTQESVDQASPVGVVAFECTVTGKISTYFGDNTLLAKLYAGTASSINARVAKNSQALIYQFPRVTFRSGVPAAGGKNQFVMLDTDFTASIDTTLTNVLALLDRLEYFE